MSTTIGEVSYHEGIGGPAKNSDSGHAIEVVLHASWFRINGRHDPPRELEDAAEAV